MKLVQSFRKIVLFRIQTHRVDPPNKAISVNTLWGFLCHQKLGALSKCCKAATKTCLHYISVTIVSIQKNIYKAKQNSEKILFYDIRHFICNFVCNEPAGQYYTANRCWSRAWWIIFWITLLRNILNCWTVHVIWVNACQTPPVAGLLVSHNLYNLMVDRW